MIVFGLLSFDGNDSQILDDILVRLKYRMGYLPPNSTVGGSNAQDPSQ